MKELIIPDCHGRETWRYAVQKFEWDRVTFLGDYLDSHDLSSTIQLHNLKEIIKFKEENPNKVILEIGNHDYSYQPGVEGWKVSGYQKAAAYDFMDLLRSKRHLFQICHIEGDIIYSHAGITTTWLENVGYDGTDLETFVNNLYEFRPKFFEFCGWDPTGDDVEQGPLWVRPNSLVRDAYKPKEYRQIVGHTVQKSGITRKENCYFTDTMGGERDFIIVEDGKITIHK